MPCGLQEKIDGKCIDHFPTWLKMIEILFMVLSTGCRACDWHLNDGRRDVFFHAQRCGEIKTTHCPGGRLINGLHNHLDFFTAVPVISL